MRKISNRVFYRFEPNLGESGLLIVFFKDTEEIYEMTEPFYLYLICLEKKFNLEEYFKEKYPNLSILEIEENLVIIEKKLIELEVII